MCVRCICARKDLLCDENCLCFPERCNNRGAEDFQDAEEEAENVPAAIDLNVLNATLAALAANQQQQQKQFQQQQMQQQQADQQILWLLS